MNTKYYGYIRRKYDDIEHYRTPGSKNGVRRYQNEDGSLTPLGRQHYNVGDPREYYNSGQAAKDNAAIKEYNRWNNIATQNRGAMPISVRRAAEGAQWRQSHVQARAQQNNMQQQRQQAADQRLNSAYDARKQREAQAYARQGQANMQQQRQHAADQRLNSAYDDRVRREGNAYARQGQANMQERRQQAADQRLNSAYDDRVRREEAKERARKIVADRQTKWYKNDKHFRDDYRETAKLDKAYDARMEREEAYEREHNPIGYYAKQAGRDVQNWANDVGTKIKDSARDQLDYAEILAEDLGKNIQQFGENAAKAFDSTIDYITENAKNVGKALSGVADSAYDKASEMANSAVENAKNFLSSLGGLFKRK